MPLVSPAVVRYTAAEKVFARRGSAEQQKALVRRCYQAWSAGEPEVLDEVLAPSYLDHGRAAGQ